MSEHDYKMEGNRLAKYTAEQLGPPRYIETHSRSKTHYDLIVMDGTNQVVVLEGASWTVCRERVKQMVVAGVDPEDIKGSPCNFAPQNDIGRLYAPRHFLWWTEDDQKKIEGGKQLATRSSKRPAPKMTP